MSTKTISILIDESQQSEILEAIRAKYPHLCNEQTPLSGKLIRACLLDSIGVVSTLAPHGTLANVSEEKRKEIASKGGKALHATYAKYTKKKPRVKKGKGVL